MPVQLQTTEVVAVVACVDAGVPQLLTVGAPGGVPALPSGPLLADHRSLQASLRGWVTEQTGLQLGFLEQLYTFADRERAGAHQRVISVSYVGLTRVAQLSGGTGHARWVPWYEIFPWEDQRQAATADLVAALRGQLATFVAAAGSDAVREARQQRVGRLFGVGERWGRPEDALARYELLWEAGLLPESRRSAGATTSWAPTTAAGAVDPARTGLAMVHDHRRIAATALSRLRGTIQYRPVVFELLPESFTLGRLQDVVEALAGTRLHKQNFRRLVEAQELVEETGETSSATGGRPAKLMRFRPDALAERPSAGMRLPGSR